MTNIEHKDDAQVMKGEYKTPRVKSGMGYRIFNWRCKRNMPLYQLSQKSHVAYSKLFYLETVDGSTIKNTDCAIKLALAMDVNPAWLYGWSDDANDPAWKREQKNVTTTEI